MEKVLFVTRLEDLSFWKEEFKRLYFGIEFCQRKIPSVEELRKAIDFSQDKGAAFTLVTPFVTDTGLDKLKLLFEALDKTEGEKEIVINDWGIANFLSVKYSHFDLSLGRLLNKQKRGPRAYSFSSNWPVDVVRYFSKARGEAIFTSRVPEKINLKRIELDNLLQGIERENSKIPASLYYPFVYITTSRYCLTAISFHEDKFRRKVNTFCNEECSSTTFSFTSKTMPVTIYLKGNTQFYKNEKLLANPASLGIDRLVYQPRIPV